MTSKIVKLIKAKLRKLEKGWDKINPLKETKPSDLFFMGKKGQTYLKKIDVPVA